MSYDKSLFQNCQRLFRNPAPEVTVIEPNNNEVNSAIALPPQQHPMNRPPEGVVPRSVRLSATTSSILTDEGPVDSRTDSFSSDDDSVFLTSSNTPTPSTASLEVNNPEETKNPTKGEEKTKKKEEKNSVKKIKPIFKENIHLLKNDLGKSGKGKGSVNVENGMKNVSDIENSPVTKAPITKQPNGQNKAEQDDEPSTDDEDGKVENRESCCEKCCLCTFTCIAFCCE